MKHDGNIVLLTMSIRSVLHCKKMHIKQLHFKNIAVFNECRKVITLAEEECRKHFNDPIKSQSNYL